MIGAIFDRALAWWQERMDWDMRARFVGLRRRGWWESNAALSDRISDHVAGRAIRISHELRRQVAKGGGR